MPGRRKLSSLISSRPQRNQCPAFQLLLMAFPRQARSGWAFGFSDPIKPKSGSFPLCIVVLSCFLFVSKLFLFGFVLCLNRSMEYGVQKLPSMWKCWRLRRHFKWQPKAQDQPYTHRLSYLSKAKEKMRRSKTGLQGLCKNECFL